MLSWDLVRGLISNPDHEVDLDRKSNGGQLSKTEELYELLASKRNWEEVVKEPRLRSALIARYSSTKKLLRDLVLSRSPVLDRSQVCFYLKEISKPSQNTDQIYPILKWVGSELSQYHKPVGSPHLFVRCGSKNSQIGNLISMLGQFGRLYTKCGLSPVFFGAYSSADFWELDLRDTAFAESRSMPLLRLLEGASN